MDLGRRWQARAAGRAHEARRDAPAWFDLERAPWWLFVLTGSCFLVLTVNSLIDAPSAWDTAWAVFGLAFLVPAQFTTAYRLRHGIPLLQPWFRRHHEEPSLRVLPGGRAR